METPVLKERFETIYPKLQNLLSWSIDKRVLLSIAALYAMGEKGFDARRLQAVSDALKSRAGFFSPVRGQFHPFIAALLDVSGDGPDELAKDLFDKQELLRELGFRNTIHSYLAATLMPDEEAEARHEAVAAKVLYDEMKRHHRFLTSDDDYAFAVLLGREGKNPVELAGVMKDYYLELKTYNFRGGNELQWMSQTVTFGDPVFNRDRVEAVADLRDRLKSAGLKVKPGHYPALGLLTAFHVEQSTEERIIEIADALSEMKLFRWYKELALSFAIQAVLREMAGMEGVDHIGMVASVEQILRAQQAIMISSGAAAAAAASAGGGGDGGS